MVRKNAKPFWIIFQGNLCVKCGKNFAQGEKIFNGNFCIECGKMEEKKLILKSKSENKTKKNIKKAIPIEYEQNNEFEKNEFKLYEFSSLCENCGYKFRKGDRILFGLFCEKCGKNWIKKRDLFLPKLKKSRGLEASKKNYENNEKSINLERFS